LKCRTLVGWLFALIWLMALPAWAVEYRLQVTNGDVLTFASYMGKATPWWRQVVIGWRDHDNRGSG
jgi:hypothetical protein